MWACRDWFNACGRVVNKCGCVVISLNAGGRVVIVFYCGRIVNACGCVVIGLGVSGLILMWVCRDRF